MHACMCVFIIYFAFFYWSIIYRLYSVGRQFSSVFVCVLVGLLSWLFCCFVFFYCFSLSWVNFCCWCCRFFFSVNSVRVKACFSFCRRPFLYNFLCFTHIRSGVFHACLCVCLYRAPPTPIFFLLAPWFTIYSMFFLVFKVRCPGPNPFRPEVRAWCRTRFFSGFPRGARRRYAICWPSLATGSAWTARR